MALIYLLNCYEEHGPEELEATLNPSLLDGMVAAFWEKKLDMTEEREKLKSALAENKTGSWNLSFGWGGLQLHIVEAKQ